MAKRKKTVKRLFETLSEASTELSAMAESPDEVVTSNKLEQVVNKTKETFGYTKGVEVRTE